MSKICYIRPELRVVDIKVEAHLLSNSDPVTPGISNDPPIDAGEGDLPGSSRRRGPFDDED